MSGRLQQWRKGLTQEMAMVVCEEVDGLGRVWLDDVHHEVRAWSVGDGAGLIG